MTENGVVKLLLVEDEEVLRTILKVAPEDEGFEVVCGNNGSKGIDLLESSAAEFKAAIIDIRLGKGPTGWDVGHRAREIVTAIPVIYMSGDSAADWLAHGVPNSVMLQKPFGMTQLIIALGTLLNSVQPL